MASEKLRPKQNAPFILQDIKSRDLNIDSRVPNSSKIASNTWKIFLNEFLMDLVQFWEAFGAQIHQKVMRNLCEREPEAGMRLWSPEPSKTGRKHQRAQAQNAIHLCIH